MLKECETSFNYVGVTHFQKRCQPHPLFAKVRATPNYTITPCRRDISVYGCVQYSTVLVSLFVCKFTTRVLFSLQIIIITSFIYCRLDDVVSEISSILLSVFNTATDYDVMNEVSYQSMNTLLCLQYYAQLVNNTEVIEINATNITHDIAASFLREVRPVVDALRVRIDKQMVNGWI